MKGREDEGEEGRECVGGGNGGLGKGEEDKRSLGEAGGEGEVRGGNRGVDGEEMAVG